LKSEELSKRWIGERSPNGEILYKLLVRLWLALLARPNSLANYRTHPLDLLAPIMVVLSLGECDSCAEGAARLPVLVYVPGRDVAGRGGGSVFCAAAVVTIARALAGPHTLHIGLVW
jgi:hypothetical protein